MQYPLDGKTALVCGCTQGIGRAAAEMLAEAGAKIIALARREDALKALDAELPSPTGAAHAWTTADFSDAATVQDAAAGAVETHGPIHILINNTGGPPAGRAVDAAPQAYADAVNAHLVCGQILVQAVVPGMRAAGYGRIINIISTSVIAPIPGLGVSNATRGAVANWARTLAGELGPDAITVNNVLPGFTRTSRLSSLLTGRAEKQGTTLETVEENIKASIPVRRMGEPRELGAVIAFLAGPEAGYVSGVNLPVDGGRTATQ